MLLDLLASVPWQVSPSYLVVVFLHILSSFLDFLYPSGLCDGRKYLFVGLSLSCLMFHYQPIPSLSQTISTHHGSYQSRPSVSSGWFASFSTSSLSIQVPVAGLIHSRAWIPLKIKLNFKLKILLWNYSPGIKSFKTCQSTWLACCRSRLCKPKTYSAKFKKATFTRQDLHHDHVLALMGLPNHFLLTEVKSRIKVVKPRSWEWSIKYKNSHKCEKVGRYLTIHKCPPGHGS